MAKGSLRKTELGLAPGGGPAPGPVFSPEAAERAAAEIVPLWKLDEAPFEAASKSAEADLLALAGPLTSPTALQMAPPPSIGAAVLPVGAGEGNGVTTGHDELMARETVRTAPPVIVHQPLPKRPTEPFLPSILVDSADAPIPPDPVLPAAEPSVVVTTPAIEPASAAPPLRVAPPAEPAPRAAAVVAAVAVEPVLPPRRADEPPRSGRQSSPDAYQVPRSRAPLWIGSAAVISALVVLGVYFASSGGSAPTGTSPSTTAPPTAATVPGAHIPPPPPVDEAPAAAAPSPLPTLPVAAAPTPPVAPPSPQTPVAAPVTAAPPIPPIAQTPPPRPAPPPPSPPRRPPAKNPPPPPKAGAIVRDNPF